MHKKCDAAAMCQQECCCDMGRRILLHVMGDTLGILYSEDPARGSAPALSNAAELRQHL